MFPLNFPSAIPETTIISPCLLPVPGKYEVECFLGFFDHRIPPCVLDVSTVILEKKTKQKRLNLVPGSVVGDVEEERKSVLQVIPVGFFLLCCKSRETNAILSTEFIVSELNL